ncbi:MAG: DUF1127 domain-containing protein [Marivivens sp.]|nr:DUF1127 domain-containing protein [Marivivens sp.]
MAQHSVTTTGRNITIAGGLRTILAYGTALWASARAAAATRAALADLSDEMLRDIALTPDDTDARLSELQNRRASRAGNW